MTAVDINDLRDTFRSAMSAWDVQVLVEVVDEDTVTVSFALWGNNIEGDMRLVGKWETTDDCPYQITCSKDVWTWIAMELSDALQRKSK